MRGIARNLCREIIRRKPRQPRSIENPENIPDPVTPERTSTPLLEAVAELPEKLREAILLFYVDQASYQEIGARLEITPAAVNRRLTRARNLLRERLGGWKESRDAS